MDPLHLKKDEIEYELNVRGIFNLSNQRTRTSALREALLRKRAGIESEPTDSSRLFLSSYEIENCSNIYANIVAIAESAETGKLGLKECSSRLLHLKGRLGRVRVADSTENKHLKELQRCTFDAMNNIAILLGDITEAIPTTNIAQHSVNSQKSKSPPSLTSVNRPVQFGLSNRSPTYTQNQNHSEHQKSIVSERFPPAVGSIEDLEEEGHRNESLYNLGDLTPDEISDIANELHSANPSHRLPIENNIPNTAEFTLPGNTENTIAPPGSSVSERQFPVVNRALPSLNQPIRPTNNRHFLAPSFATNHRNALPIENRSVDFSNRRQNVNIAQDTSNSHRPLLNHIENYHSYRIHNERNHNVNDIRPEIFQRTQRYTIRNQIGSRKSIPVYQWRVVYSGDDKELHLYDFLSQVEVLRRSEQLSEEELLTSVVHLLSGRARLWYHSNYDNFHNWNQFTCALKKEFLPPNYDYILLSDISNRVQKSNETYSEFIMHMNALFRCLSCPLSEDYKLFLVRKNLVSRYAIGVAALDISNLQELSTACRRIDGALNRQTQLNLPFQQCNRNNSRPINRNNDRNRELNAVDVPADIDENNPEILEIKAKPNDRIDKNVPCNINQKLKCWNCSVEGHRFQECQLPRKKFCYRCGLPNVTVPNCQKCQGNEKRNLGAQGNDRA